VSRIQKSLFPEAERLKLLHAQMPRMKASDWNRFWKKGWDPAYLLKVAVDDIPTLAETWKQVDSLGDVVSTAAAPGKRDLEIRRIRALVLSKGIEDRNRRIVAIGGGSWMFGLLVALLQRQVRQGTMDVQGKCYATLTNLECCDNWGVVVDRWTTDLIHKMRL
jgi:hypothetical protein